MKNKKWLILFSITLLALLVTFLLKPYSPKETKKEASGIIGNVERDMALTQKFISKVDILDSIVVRYANFNKKIKKGNLNFKVFDEGNNKIYEQDFKLSELADNQDISLNFEPQRGSLGEVYTLTIKASGLNGKKPITFYSLDTEIPFTSTGEVDGGGSILVVQHGHVRGYYYAAILGLIFIIEFLVFAIKYYKDNNKTIKYKKLNNVFILLVSLILAVCFLDCRLDLYTDNRLSYITFPLLLISSIIVIRNAVITYYSGDYEDLFLALAIPIGTLFFLTIVPGMVPDEPFHYNIAYQMSKGNFLLNKYKVYELKPDIANYIEIKESIVNSIPIGLVHKDGLYRVGGYSQLLYLPAAFGMAVAHIFNVSELFAIYAGSYCNFLVFLVLGYYLIKYIPFGKLLAIVYLLTPMNLQQVTSVSCDALINMTCLLFIAYVLNLKYSKEDLELKNGIILGILALFVVNSKFAYFPLLLILLLLKDKIKNKKYNLKVVIPLVVFLVVSAICYVYVSQINTAYTIGANVSGKSNIVGGNYSKIGYLLLQPLNIVYLGFNTLITHFDFYITSFVGRRLGWLDVYIPEILIHSYLILLVLSCFVEKSKNVLNNKEKKLMVLIWTINTLVIMSGLYLGHGNVRNLRVDGVQGRYFIPISLLLFLCLYSNKQPIKWKHAKLFIVLTLAIIDVLVVSNVIDWFLLM